jgi:hypothetical protein
MGENLTQRRRVGDEGFRVVNPFWEGRKSIREQRVDLTVPPEKATANSVPAAAVRQRWRALFGITGRKEHVGGWVSPM